MLLEFFFLLEIAKAFAELSTSFLKVYSGDRSVITPLVIFATNFAIFSAFYAALLSYIAGLFKFALPRLIKEVTRSENDSLLSYKFRLICIFFIHQFEEIS